MTQTLMQLLYQIDRAANGFMRTLKVKLHTHVHKGGWEDCSYEYLRLGIDRELAELDEAIQNGAYIDAQLECADVAAYLMMIHDNLEYDRFKEFK